MTMTRYRRIAELWNWLPGFRGVAEHESVNEAASALNVSPSALSRTVKLLESALGTELFVRKGTGIELAPFGAQLLAVTRDAMRQIDDCIAAEDRRRSGHGPIYVGIASELAGAVVARALAGRLEGLGKVHVVRVADDDTSEELLRGDVDLVVATHASPPSELVAVRLGDLGFAAYASASHPVSAVAVDDAPELAGAVVAVRCDSIDVARAICERGPHACVLPRLGWPPLVEVASVGEPATLYALHRPPLPSARDDHRLPTIIASLQQVIAGAE